MGFRAETEGSGSSGGVITASLNCSLCVDACVRGFWGSSRWALSCAYSSTQLICTRFTCLALSCCRMLHISVLLPFGLQLWTRPADGIAGLNAVCVARCSLSLFYFSICRDRDSIWYSTFRSTAKQHKCPYPVERLRAKHLNCIFEDLKCISLSIVI